MYNHYKKWFLDIGYERKLSIFSWIGYSNDRSWLFMTVLENVQKDPLLNIEMQESICEWIENKKRIAVA